MIEKQAGIQVVVQVDPEAQSALLDDQETLAVRHASVLATALGLVACLDRDSLARNLEGDAGGTHQIGQARRCHVLRNFLGRRVLLHVQPGGGRLAGIRFLDTGIHVDRRRVLGNVRIVGAPTMDIVAGERLAQVPHGLAQAIGDGFGTRAQWALIHLTLRCRCASNFED